MPIATDPILALCRELGFAHAGIADASPSRWAKELTDWLAAGKHGSMSWLEKNLALRLDPALLLPGARAAIMVADLYAAPGAGGTLPAGHGRIARYARGRDYHAVLKKRLHALADRLRADHPGHRFRAFTDSAPVLERELAQRAGLGWVGKHTLLIHPRFGSYFFLGGLLTTLPVAAPPAPRPLIADHCGTCTRCIDACPTRAITPYSVDASRCIAYLTIEHRAEIEPSFHAPIGDNLFGCDICQEVCPHNRGIGLRADASAAWATPINASASGRSTMPLITPAYTPIRSSLPLLEILSWTEEDRRAALQSSALKRATLSMMKRNALVVAGNSCGGPAHPALFTRIAEVAVDPAEPDLVRAAARSVLRAAGAPDPNGHAARPGPEARPQAPEPRRTKP